MSPLPGAVTITLTLLVPATVLYSHLPQFGSDMLNDETTDGDRDIRRLHVSTDHPRTKLHTTLLTTLERLATWNHHEIPHLKVHPSR